MPTSAPGWSRQRPHAHRAAEQPSHPEHRQLDHGSHGSDPQAPPVMDACHEPIARAGTELLPHWRWTAPEGGLSVWITGTRHDAAELVSRARGRGVALHPGALFSPRGTGWPHALRLPFSGRSAPLRHALEVLAEIES